MEYKIMSQDGKRFEEDLKRKELKERRKRLELERKSKVEEAESAKGSGDFLRAKDLYMQAAEISKELAEKERMRTFRATAEEMLNLEKTRREESSINEKRKNLQGDRRKYLAEAETLMKEGKFRDAAKQYKLAANLSLEMKEEERAKELQAMAKEIIEKEFEYLKKWEKEKDVKLKEAQLARVLAQAEDALQQTGLEEKAADLYIEGAKLTRALGRTELAEKYVERAKQIREIKKEMQRRIEEEKKKRELEQKRQMYEDQRSQAITRAEKSMEVGKFKDAANYYELAGEASAGLGEKAIAQEFKSTAKKIIETMDELVREFKEKQRKKPLRMRRRILIAKAKQQLEREKYVESAKLFKLAAVISGEMGEDAKVKELIAKVQEAMKMEKRRKEEVIDRVMKAFKAIVTLRTMEPEVAVNLYEWTGDGAKYVVVYVWDIGAITLKFEKGKPQITSGEHKKDVSVRLEGTASSIMQVAQGKISQSWAILTGRMVIRGNSRNVTYFTNLMIIPTLEREKDELDARSTKWGMVLALLTFAFVTHFPIVTDWSTLETEPLINYVEWGNTIISSFIINIPQIGPYLAKFLDPWTIANFWIFPMIYIVISSSLNLMTIHKYRVSQAKERLRIKRRRAMDKAEKASKSGSLPEAIRLYEEAVKYALHSGEDEIAKELVTKIAEIIKLIPAAGGKKKKKKGKKGKGKGKKRGAAGAAASREREEMRAEAERFQKQMEEYVQEAEKALEDQDFLGSAKAYGKAAEVAKNIGDKDKVVQFSAQAEELLKIHKDLEKERKKQG
jgi:SCP-2 sterol transfer family